MSDAVAPGPARSARSDLSVKASAVAASHRCLVVARAALRVVYAPTAAEANVFGRLQIATDFGAPMKSLTGALEYDLKSLQGETLPDGMVPMWRPGALALKASCLSRE